MHTSAMFTVNLMASWQFVASGIRLVQRILSHTQPLPYLTWDVLFCDGVAAVHQPLIVTTRFNGQRDTVATARVSLLPPEDFTSFHQTIKTIGKIATKLQLNCSFTIRLCQRPILSSQQELPVCRLVVWLFHLDAYWSQIFKLPEDLYSYATLLDSDQKGGFGNTGPCEHCTGPADAGCTTGDICWQFPLLPHCACPLRTTQFA